MIQAKIVADSICNNHRITTMRVTMPRIILAEAKTHRIMSKLDEGFEIYEIPGVGFNDDEMLSRNSASSRAIPFKKMVQIIMTNPFIPLAWQRDHNGMQGTDYIDPNETFSVNDYIPVMQRFLNDFVGGNPEVDNAQAFEIYTRLLDKYDGQQKTMTGWWLEVRDRVVEVAMLMNMFGLTKQLCNRLLEPFMWHTVLVTATELENFFYLRCPQYWLGNPLDITKDRSRKDAVKRMTEYGFAPRKPFTEWTDLDWLKMNQGQAEIHMMALAEAMWDARNESTPKELKPGEWHLPYAERIDWDIACAQLQEYGKEYPINSAIKICTAFAAQTSYTVVGTDVKDGAYSNLVDLHNSLLLRPYTNRKGVVFGPDDPIHTSPAEHCAQAMTEKEYNWSVKRGVNDSYVEERGWCHNLRGWKSYRSMIPNENRR